MEFNKLVLPPAQFLIFSSDGERTSRLMFDPKYSIPYVDYAAEITFRDPFCWPKQSRPLVTQMIFTVFPIGYYLRAKIQDREEPIRYATRIPVELRHQFKVFGSSLPRAFRTGNKLCAKSFDLSYVVQNIYVNIV